MITQPLVLVLFAILLTLYGIGTYQDIKFRKTYHLTIPMAVLIVAGVVINLIVSGFNINVVISYLICLALFLIGRAVNILRVYHNKGRFLGGSDLNIYVVSVSVYPLFFGFMWSSLVILAVTCLLLSFCAFSKKRVKGWKQRGIPLIPYIGAGTFIPIFIELAVGLFF